MKKMFLMALLVLGAASVSFGAFGQSDLTDSDLTDSDLTDNEKQCIQACRLAKADECLAKKGYARKVGIAKDTCLFECDMELKSECYGSCVMPEL